MNIRKYILEKLKNADVSQEELSAETNFIMRNFLNIKNPYIEIELSDFQKRNLEQIFVKRKKNIPLQQIIGIADFMGEQFIVDKNVLIPRPETEILVNETIKKATSTSRILDIGTGSGCIAISISKTLPTAKVFSCDISKEALEIAKENNKKLNTTVSFIHSDLFININEKFDIIVSNPPYIPPQEKQNIQKEVSYEPDLALYTADEKGIEFYKKIIIKGKDFLNDNGYILFELGINQSGLVKSIFEEYNYKEIEIIKDLDNIDRVILARI